MRKGLFAALFCAMMFLLLPAAAYAAGGDLGGNEYDGSPQKPYQIEDAADLQAFAQIVNGGNAVQNTSAWAVLTANIDLHNENWTPIGSKSKPYTGTFDGKEYTISELQVDITDSSDVYAGLFGYVSNGGMIQNVGVVDSDISADVSSSAVYARGVCGWNNNGTITNCYHEGEVTGNSGNGNNLVYAGGVCGFNFKGTITNCYFLSGTAAGGIGSGNGTATNVEEKTSDQFASGQVAWLLDQGTHQWAQKLGTEDLPRPVMKSGDEKYAVVQVLVHLPENAGDISCYTNINTVLSAYPSRLNGKKICLLCG